MKKQLAVGFIVVFGLGFLAGQSLLGQPARVAPDAAPVERVSSQEPELDLTEEERRNIDVFQRASASVVYITSLARYRTFFFDETRISGSGTRWIAVFIPSSSSCRDRNPQISR